MFTGENESPAKQETWTGHWNWKLCLYTADHSRLIDFSSSVKVLSCWRETGWSSSWTIKGQKIGRWKRKKDIHREHGAQRIPNFGDFQTGQDKALVPEEAKVCSIVVWGCDPTFCLVPSFHNPDFYHHIASVIKVSAILHIPQLYLLACKHEVHQSVSLLISFSITCVKNLSVPSRNLLDCLCPDAWPFQQISWWFKPTMRPRASEYEACAHYLKKVSFTFS